MDIGVPKPSTTIYFAPRERAVFAQISFGIANKEIGAVLGMADGTVKSHLAALMKKTGTSDRYALRTFALQFPESIVYGWIPAGTKLHAPGCTCERSYCAILRPIAD